MGGALFYAALWLLCGLAAAVLLIVMIVRAVREPVPERQDESEPDIPIGSGW